MMLGQAIGNAYVTVRGDTTGFDRDVSGGLTKTLAGWTRTATKVAIGATTLVGGAVATAIARGGISRAMQLEEAQVQMGRLGVTTSDFNDIVGTVDDTFDGSIFTRPQGLAIVSQLMMAGMHMDDVNERLGLTADLAAAGNVPIEQMNDILLRVQNNGKLSAEEINRLADANISVSLLAESMGLTVAELREMTTAGEVTADVFFDAISTIEQYEGAAQSAGDATRGAFSNVMSQLSLLGERMFSPLFGPDGPLVTLFKAARQAAIDLRPVASSIGEMIAANVVPRIEALTKWIEDGGVSRGVENLTGWFRDMFAQFKDGEGPLNGLVEGFKAFTLPARLLATEVLPALMPVLKEVLPILAQVAADVAPALADALMAVAEVAIPLLVGMLEYLADNPAVTEFIVKAGLIVFALIKIAPIIATVVGAVGKFISIVKLVIPVIKGLWALLMANPIALIIAAVIGVAFIIYKYWDEIVAFLTGVWDWMKEAGAVIWDAVSDAATAVRDWVVGAWETVTEAVGAAWEWIKDALGAATEWIVKLFNNWHPIGIIISNWDSIMEAIGAAWEWIKTTTENIWNGLLSWLGGIWTSIRDRARDGWNLIRDSIRGVLTALRDWITGLWNGIVEFITGLGTRLFSGGKSIFTRLWDGIKEIGRKVVSWVSDTFGGIVETITGLGSRLYNAGKNILTQLWNGIKEVGRKVVQWVIDNVVQKIRNLWPFSPAKEGPFSGSGSPFLAGKNLMNMFADGLRAEGRDVVDAALSATSGLALALPNASMVPTRRSHTPASNIPVHIEMHFNGTVTDHDAQRAGYMAAEALVEKLASASVTR